MLKDYKYSDIIKENNELKAQLVGQKSCKVSVLSNLITHQLNEILEFAIRSEGINAEVTSGDYDNILQNATNINDSDVVIIMWELLNITDGFYYKIHTMSDDQLLSLLNHVKNQLTLIAQSLQKCRMVVFNSFSSLLVNSNFLNTNKLDAFCKELNEYISSLFRSNVHIINIDRIIALNSVENSADYRYFNSSKSLYTLSFYKSYVSFIMPLFNSLFGKTKKVLVFDCDNTLWKGIIGEEGLNGIQMSSSTSEGIPFSEIQHYALDLYKQGVLLALCSKNNLADVEDVLENHPDMLLKSSHFVSKKVNWEDKASNIKLMAQELNLGLDSFVFIDDSDFEINYVKSQLPEVTVIQVPKKRHNYPTLFKEVINLFFRLSTTNEDAQKSEMYRQELNRNREKLSMGSLKEYIENLKIKLSFFVDDKAIIARMAQLTQKTNQFNLTTKRYSETEIEQMVESDKFSLVAMQAEDKFGEYGIVGLGIVSFKDKKAVIDTFLMSCRIIGREVEFSFIQQLISMVKKRNFGMIEAKFIRTPKNNQVELFYKKCGFEVAEETTEGIKYVLNLNS